MTDLIPAPRPVESPEDRMRHATADTAPDRSFAAYLTAHERDQLDARAAAAEQERDDALDDVQELKTHHAELHTRLNAAENDLRSQTEALREALAERDRARELLTAVKASHKRTRAQLERAEHAIDLMRDASEQLDRALTAWETQQQPQEQPSSVPSRRAQDERTPICGDPAHRHSGPCEIYA